MTSSPQMQQRPSMAPDSRRRTSTVLPAAQEAADAARGRARQALPAVDPSKEFGCVDWYLYPEALEAQVKSVPA